MGSYTHWVGTPGLKSLLKGESISLVEGSLKQKEKRQTITIHSQHHVAYTFASRSRGLRDIQNLYDDLGIFPIVKKHDIEKKDKGKS